jgi:hypothetical protein
MKAPPALVPAFVLFAVLVAGCASSPAASSTITIDFGGSPATVTATILAGDGAYPAQALYQANGVTHPAYYSAFDQLMQWSRQSGVKVEASHASFGFFLSKIDGRPTASNQYWSLSVNGTVSDVGMDQVKVVDGSRITWKVDSF